MYPEWNGRQTLLQINNTHNLHGLFKVELKFHLYSMYIVTIHSNSISKRKQSISKRYMYYERWNFL